MRCGKTPADCLACTRAVCVWDEPMWVQIRRSPKMIRAFGDALLAERELLGLTQAEMAKHLGVGYSAYRGWERGKCCPHRSNWYHLVQQLPALVDFAEDKAPYLYTQPDDGQEAPGRNGSNV